jgi:uncharacterized protein YjiS (DUF1127 family)
MAFQSDNTLISNREMLGQLALAPFRAIARAIIFMAESNSRAQTLRALAAMTDDQLAARGLTRAEVVSMAFRHDV